MARTPTTQTPLWVRATLILIALTVLTYLTAVHLDRVGNQRRLSAIATQIAGRPVTVHCPGIIGRIGSAYDQLGGTVNFDPHGRPDDHTDLRAAPCAELDALAEGRRTGVLRCVACATPGAIALAAAVDTVTHEAFHLKGIVGEAETECRSLAEMARTAERLGATPEQGAALAALQRRTNYVRMPDQYHGDCERLTAR